MSRSGIITIIIILLILVAVGFFAATQGGGDQRGSEAARVLVGSEGESSYTDLDGNPFSFEAYEGSVRVVNSWASWCPFCVNELPDFSELAKEFESQDVAVIAINRKESDALARAFVAQLKAADGIVFVQDPSDTFYKTIGGFSMPETIFYDKEGNVSFHKRGFMTLEEMRERTQTALDATN